MKKTRDAGRGKANLDFDILQLYIYKKLHTSGCLKNLRKIAYQIVTKRMLNLRWLDTVFFFKDGNLRFRSVFLENYYLFEDKEYFCYIKPHPKSSNSLCTTAVAMATIPFQNGGYFGFKVI